MWPEICTAKNENRHELILSGNDISQRITNNGLEQELFNLTALNLLRISDTTLDNLPENISKLVNLQTLLLHANKLSSITAKIGELLKLKVLDLSNNQLTEVPAEISQLTQLTSLNLSLNKLEKFPILKQNTKLSVLDLSNNQLEEFPDICYLELACLSEIKLNTNHISAIPSEINKLSSLKILDISSNRISVVPGELSDISKLKEINLKENPVADKRLLKLIDQCRSKQVLDYVRQHCTRKSGGKAGGTAGGGKKSTNKKSRQYKNSEQGGEDGIGGDEPTIGAHQLIVARTSEQDKLPDVRIMDTVKPVRPYILCCIVKNVHFDEQLFKRFIQMQTKLHDSVCEKRNAATIATHDLNKLPLTPVGSSYALTYTARAPGELLIRPLGRNASNPWTGARLFDQLQAEAEALRKEKKRNAYSGVHRYLYLLEGKPMYPCLLDATERVISFPPITNSDDTKISLETTSIFMEVTSATSQDICRKVMDTILKETLLLGIGGHSEDAVHNLLSVQRVKIVDCEGNMKAVYPSRADLNYDTDTSIKVIRN